METESQNKYLSEIYPRIEKRLKIPPLFKAIICKKHEWDFKVHSFFF